MNLAIHGLEGDIREGISHYDDLHNAAEHFSFKPVPEVMSNAELLTHIVETQYVYCNTVKGGANPGASLNFKVTDKAAVGQLVRDSFAYCDDAFAAVTNENDLEMLTRGSAPNQRQWARVNQPTQLIVHGNEHYGNLVTYMRMKGSCRPRRCRQPNSSCASRSSSAQWRS